MKRLRARRSNRATTLARALEQLERRQMFDANYFNLSTGTLTQNWDNTPDQLTTANTWTGVASIEGYNGAGITSGTGVNPTGFTAATPTGALNVAVNITQSPNTYATGGVAELNLASPIAGIGGATTGNTTVAFQGSGSANAPYLKFYLNAGGVTDVHMKYDLIDIDGGAAASAQQVNLQYRTSPTGTWANVPGGYTSDASDFTSGGPSTGKQTSFDVVLPSAANQNGQLEVRIITSDAVGADQLIAIENISISGTPATVQPGTLALASSTFSTSEGVGTYDIVVNRTNGSSNAVAATWTLTPGTATSPADFNGPGGVLTGTVSFAAGQTSATITVTIAQDTIVEQDETFTVTLSNPTNGASLGTPSSATVTIVDDDNAGTIDFANATATVSEAAGTVTLTLNRSVGSSGAVSIDYATADGTAVSPGDYLAATGTVNFANGATTGTVVITLTNDTTLEPNETFTVSLLNPTGGLVLGSTITATVTILDDDVVIPNNVFINEAFIDPPGTNAPKQFIELKGTPGASADNLVLMQIEGDFEQVAGSLDYIFSLAGSTFGSNGLLLITAATNGWTPQDPATNVFTTTQLDLPNLGFETGSYSFVLAYRIPTADPLPTVGTDFDSDDVKDANGLGTLDALPTDFTILDGFGTTDGGGNDLRYVTSLPALASGGSADAIVRTTTTVGDPNAFYYGILAGSSGNTTLTFSTTTTQRSTNFPAGVGLVTPGAVNAGVVATPPTVVSTVFDAKAGQKVVVTFSDNVGASIAATDFTLTLNGPTPTNVALAVSSISADGKTVTLTFANTGGVTPNVLLNGNYTFVTRGGQVSAVGGGVLAGDVTQTFKFLNADFNVDNSVGFTDLVTLAQNYNQTGRTFAQGDANYDGKVDFSDLVILAQRYGNVASLAGLLSLPTEPEPTKDTTKKDGQIGEVVPTAAATPVVATKAIGTKTTIK